MSYRRSQGGKSSTAEDDRRPYCRLFIVCSKTTNEAELREAFSNYGNITDARFVRDHASKERKGIAYITFSKTSEAANAIENLNGKVIGNSRPLKVMVASNKSDDAGDDDERYRRLFITIPKNYTEDDVKEKFSEFGSVDSVIIQRDRNSFENKGFAYVKYHSFTSSAKAFENADKMYRAIFAEPKRSRPRLDSFDSKSSNSLAPTIPGLPEGYNQLIVYSTNRLPQGYIWRLFDIIPGLEGISYEPNQYGEAFKLTYDNQISAAYAREKLNNFVFPPGDKLSVQPFGLAMIRERINAPPTPLMAMTQNLHNAIQPPGGQTDITELMNAIAKATGLIKDLTNNKFEDMNENYCDVKLPPKKPFASIDTKVQKRCFLVCRPHPPPLHALKDVFCRFGDLIDVYTLPNKNVGYAHYGSIEAAEEARKIVHGAQICGVRMKVLEAEERETAHNSTDQRSDESLRKRIRTEQ